MILPILRPLFPLLLCPLLLQTPPLLLVQLLLLSKLSGIGLMSNSLFTYNFFYIIFEAPMLQFRLTSSGFSFFRSVSYTIPLFCSFFYTFNSHITLFFVSPSSFLCWFISLLFFWSTLSKFSSLCFSSLLCYSSLLYYSSLLCFSSLYFLLPACLLFLLYAFLSWYLCYLLARHLDRLYWVYSKFAQSQSG